MEVHAHTHTSRKKWTHYFWEFFMLFLAVTLGFFVENQREHFIEKKREKKYIASIVEDLKSDTAWANKFFVEQNLSIIYYDSAMLLLQLAERNEAEQQRLYYMVRMGIRLSNANLVNENAYEQMKNSGNLRLLHSQKIADSISRYYFNLKEIDNLTALMTLRQQAVTEYEAKIFDGFTYQQMVDSRTFEIKPPAGNPVLATKDRLVINEFVVRSHYLKSLMVYTLNFAIKLKSDASRLIQFLKKEYHLK